MNVKRKAWVARHFLRWVKFTLVCVLLLSLPMFYLNMKPYRVMPKSFIYDDGWQHRGVCNFSKISAAQITTLHDTDFDLNMFVHNPKMDQISEILYHSNNLKDVPSAKLVKAFLDVFTDIDYVIDIGAHIGSISILSAMMGKKVVAIDADKENLNLLCSSVVNSSLQKNVVIIHGVVGMSHKAVTWAYQTNGNHSGNYVDTKDITWSQKSGSNWRLEGRAPFMMDNMMDMLPNMSASNVFVSIDVNGYENIVLSGAHLFFKKTKVRGVLINFKYHKSKSSGSFIVQILKKTGLHPYCYLNNTLVNLEKYKISDWPDQIMWI